MSLTCDCSVNATKDGKEAILQLACGDLRRVLNLLQSTSMAYPEVNKETVYLTAGAAVPEVIESIFKSLLSDSFEVAYNNLLNVISFCLVLLVRFYEICRPSLSLAMLCVTSPLRSAFS